MDNQIELLATSVWSYSFAKYCMGHYIEAHVHIRMINYVISYNVVYTNSMHSLLAVPSFGHTSILKDSPGCHPAPTTPMTAFESIPSPTR